MAWLQMHQLQDTLSQVTFYHFNSFVFQKRVGFSGETETMKTKWSKLQEMEKKLYLEVITGVKDLDEFDRFVEEWMEAGGEQITLEVTEAVREAKGA